jgi:hypothetical protein
MAGILKPFSKAVLEILNTRVLTKEFPSCAYFSKFSAMVKSSLY